MIVFAEVLNAWSGLESFAVSLVVLSFEMGVFARFIVGSSCNRILPLLRKYLDPVLHGDDVCFDAQLSITPAVPPSAWATG